jgi:alkanesulfonate monooxygenase SsuD/methylene tetrahydromethanopterin reductase-like flavin-dependent oxidoreductase (luciferase family)
MTSTVSTTEVGFVAPPDAGAVRALEQAGAASLWVGGHVASPNGSPEPIAWLGRLVEQTARVPIGTATLLLPLYPPAIVAKQLADLDRASDGRLVIGIGVGGEYAADFRAANVPIDERGSRTNEAMPLLRQFWTGEPVTHRGTHFQFDDVRIFPAPAQPGGPKLIVTGRQPVAMRRAALLGDGWMPYLYSARRYAESVARVRKFAADAGRDLANFVWGAYVFVSVDDDPAVARRRAAEFLGGTYRQDFDAMLDRVAVHGTVEQVTEKLQAFVDAGARQFVIAGGGPDSAHRLLTEVVPELE